MKPRHTQRASLALTAILAVGLMACGKEKGTKTPDVVDTGGGGGAGTVVSAEAREEFDKTVARYQKAKEKGSLSSTECGELANAFHALYVKHPNDLPAAEFNVGAIHEECGDTKKAEEIYQALAKKNYHLAYNNLGVLAARKGKEKEAIEYFKKAIEADKKRAFAARNNLAAMHRERYSKKPDQADFGEAEKQIQNVLAVDTSNRLAYENLARLYYDRGKTKDKNYKLLSQLVVTQAIRVLKAEGQESADIFNLQGLLYMQDGNQVDALKAFKRAVEISSNHTDANLNIAFISIRFRDYKGAEEALAKALKDPSTERNIEAYIAMGVAKRGLKKYKEAEEWYNKAGKIDSKDARPYYNLGILYHEHMTNQENVDVAKTEELYNVAKKHFKKFQESAGGDKKLETLVADAKDRIVIIDDAIDSFRKQEEMAKQMAEMQKKEEEMLKKERERLLELEKQAEAAAAGGGGETPPPAGGS